MDFESFSTFYQYSNLTKEREKELFEKLDEEARDEIIKSHLKLVLMISKRYSFVKNGLQKDIIHEGVVGLIKAIDRFDPDFGCRFSTIARFYIQNGIRSFLRELDPFLYVELDVDISDGERFRQKQISDIDKSFVLEKVYDLIEDIDDIDKKILILRYDENKTWRQIGESIGMCHEAVRKRHQKTILRIRDSFDVAEKTEISLCLR